MPFPKSIRLNTKPWLVVVTAASTLLAGVQMLLAAGPETKAPSPGMGDGNTGEPLTNPGSGFVGPAQIP